MAVKDIGKDAVEYAVAEFARLRQRAMLEKYGGGASKKWYLKIDNHHYDQKLIIRAAHVHQGLGELAPARNLSTTLRHRRSRFTEQSVLLWM